MVIGAIGVIGPGWRGICTLVANECHEQADQQHGIALAMVLIDELWRYEVVVYQEGQQHHRQWYPNVE